MEAMLRYPFLCYSLKTAIKAENLRHKKKRPGSDLHWVEFNQNIEFIYDIIGQYSFLQIISNFSYPSDWL